MTNSTDPRISRRDSFRYSAAAGLGALCATPLLGGLLSGCQSGSRGGASASAGPAMMNPPRRTRVFRLAHLTDTHIQPEKGAFNGVAACLRHAQSYPSAEAPQVIVTGGDLIMDGFENDYDRTKLQWELWQRVLKDECSIPVVHTLGNHDIWGWNKSKSRTTGTEAGWGKRWACEMVGRDLPYGSYDLAGIRIIILDSTQVEPNNPNGYIAYCDDAQFDWLERSLRDTPSAMPVVVVSHISIVSATGLVHRKPGMQAEDHRVGRGIMHADATKLTTLFAKHPNVRTCLSGHMHRVERLDIEGVTYLCNGAVSGGWWGGPNGTTEAGYALVDIYDDGSVGSRYVPYGWQYRA